MRFLSDHKKNQPVRKSYQLILLLLPVCIMLLAACTTESNSPANITDAISQGLIMPVEDALVQEVHREIVTAYSGELVASVNFNVAVYFPIQQNLYFENDTGEFTLFAEDSVRVSEGDELAHLSLDSERIEISRIQAEIRLQQFNQNTANEAARRRTEINNARFSVEHANNDADMARLLLHLAQLELSYDRFRFETANTRSTLTQELEELQYAAAGEYLLAPFDGMIRGALPIQSDFFDGRRPRILTLIDEDTFFLEITVTQSRQATLQLPPTSILSYGKILTIQSHNPNYQGPPTISFDARIVTDPWGAGRRTNFTFLLVPVDPDGFMEKLYNINPYDPMRILSTVNLQTNIPFTVVDYGILLPHNVIHTQGRLSFVFVYEQGNLIRRFVTPGVRSGPYLHIISGIDAGERVVILP